MKTKFGYANVMLLCVLALGLSGCVHSPSLNATRSAGVTLPSVEPADFNGVWETADPALVVRPEFGTPPYTAAAQKWINDFKLLLDPVKDDSANFCGIQGMPWTMLGRARTYPVEIYQTSDRVAMFFEVFDSYRNIRIGGEVPKNVPSSVNGYSVAHWDGASLVIATKALVERPFPNLQLRSEQTKIVERWTREKNTVHGDVILVDIEIEDPIVYTRNVVGRKVFKRSVPGTVVGGYNCPERLWQEHVEKRLRTAPERK